MTSTRPKSHFRLADLLIGARVAIALQVVAELDIAEKLARQPMDSTELASALELDSDAIKRLLRGLSTFGVFSESEEGTFSNTALSEHLREGDAHSLRHFSQYTAFEEGLRSWLRLPDALATGKPTFADANGAPLFDYLGKNAEAGNMFNSVMTSLYGPEAPYIARGCGFNRFSTILDVGGGHGHILAEILRANPETKGAVFDLQGVASAANAFLTKEAPEERWSVLEGNFFESVPTDYDAYFMKSIIHDWDDARANEILRSVRTAMPLHAKLLLAEVVVVPGKAIGHPNKLIDLEMMVMLGGRERSRDDYAALFKGADLVLDTVRPIPGSFFWLVEGSPNSP